jgi:hypothetical protein
MSPLGVIEFTVGLDEAGGYAHATDDWPAVSAPDWNLSNHTAIFRDW